MGYRRTGPDERKLNYSERRMSHWHFVCYKSLTNCLGWSLGHRGQIPATIRLILDSLCFCIVALPGHKEMTYKNGGDLMWDRTSVLEAPLSAVPFCLLSMICVTIHNHTHTNIHTYIQKSIHIYQNKYKYTYIHKHTHTSYMHKYMHAYIHTYIHSYVQAYIQTCTHTHGHHTYIHTHIHTRYIHIYIHTFIHTYIQTYIHAYIHTYIHTCIHTYILYIYI
jgi:hypothetical protein